MKIVIAPDSYKGNLSSIAVADYIAAGVRKADPTITIVQFPVADGGEGSVEAILAAAGGQLMSERVTGPLGEMVDAYWGLLADGETAVIEIAAAAGLHLVPEALRNPMETTTWGVGQLIMASLSHGVRRVIICLGGSCTNDAGTGMIQALGGVFFNHSGQVLGYGGKILKDIDKIDLSHLDERLANIQFIAACDVRNPLDGPTGAAYVYAPQKGADSEMVKNLDIGLACFSEVVHRSLGIQVSAIPGAGAAGGLGAALVAFLGATLKPGIEVVMEIADFAAKVCDADLLITGEGRTDGQTAYGKVPVGLAQVASKFGVPVVCISGGLAGEYEEIYKQGITAAFSNVTDAMPLHEAMTRSGEMTTKTAYAITRLLLIIKEQKQIKNM